MKPMNISSKSIVVIVAKQQGLEIMKRSIKLFRSSNTLFCWQGKKPAEANVFFKERGIILHSFSSRIKNKILKQKNKSFSWLLNLWGGEIFSGSFLLKFRHSLNVHPSYLPFGRGRDPIVWGLIREDPLGFTFHEISPKIDSGRILYRKKIKMNFPTKGAEAYRAVIKNIPNEFAKFWRKTKNKKKIRLIKQNYTGNINKRRKLLKGQIIDLSSNKKAKDIILKLLAFDFSDKFRLHIKYKKKKYQACLSLKETHE
jgi:methionyl-tRNA formyltransferase